MAFTLDGSTVQITNVASVITNNPLTTTFTNDVVICSILLQSSGGSITSVVGSTLGAFTLRDSVTDGSGQFLFTYWAPAASVLTSEVVTVTIGGTIFFANSMVFAINGSTNISSPFDSHGPQHSTAGAAVMATTASTAFVFSAISDSNNTGAAGTSWTLISSEIGRA